MTKIVKLDDSNKNLPAKQKSAHDEAQEAMFMELVESLIPKIKPIIGPATKKFEDFMNEDNMVLIKAVAGKVHIFHVKQSDVESFSMKEGAEPQGVYKVEDFVELLLSGKFGDVLQK